MHVKWYMIIAGSYCPPLLRNEYDQLPGSAFFDTSKTPRRSPIKPYFSAHPHTHHASKKKNLFATNAHHKYEIAHGNCQAIFSISIEKLIRLVDAKSNFGPLFCPYWTPCRTLTLTSHAGPQAEPLGIVHLNEHHLHLILLWSIMVFVDSTLHGTMDCPCKEPGKYI